MKILSLLSGVALVTFAVTAGAHAHLQKSSPAEGAVITTSPSGALRVDRQSYFCRMHGRIADGLEASRDWPRRVNLADQVRR
jgi:hypothetical protein